MIFPIENRLMGWITGLKKQNCLHPKIFAPFWLAIRYVSARALFLPLFDHLTFTTNKKKKKTDLNAERKVATQEGADFAKKLNIPFLEVSAQTGENVNLVFEKLAQSILEKKSGPAPTTSTKRRGGCNIIWVNKQVRLFLSFSFGFAQEKKEWTTTS